MWEYLAERKAVIVTIILAIGLLAFFTFRPSDTANVKSANTTASGEVFTEVNMKSAMTKGKPDAKVSIIQYSDLICPSCSYFSTQIMPTIQKKYVDTGNVKFEFRPMAFIADGSTHAGMGAYCAVDQDKFWGYHDAVYNVVVDKVFRQRLDPKTDVILTAADVKNIAASSGLDAPLFNSCMDTKKHLADISASTQRANRNGVTSTPYILVNGTAYTGDISLTAFEAFIKAQL